MKSIRERSLRGALVGGVALGVFAAAATPSSAQVSDPTVEEVVVTALKRDTKLLDTPAAISAISAEVLAAQQVTSLADLGTRAPSLNVGEASGVSYVSIRGISINSTTGGIENPVAIHLDGVYLAQSTSLDFLMLDLASVEVLRGPQGTLYGRNATGGTINFVTAKPTEAYEGTLDATAGSYRAFRVNMSLSGPIAPNLTGRISVLGAAQAEGYFDNLATGRSIGPMAAVGARGALRFTPSDAVTLDFSAFAYSENNDGIAMFRRNPLNRDAKTRNPLLATAREYKSTREVYLSNDPDARRWLDGAVLSASFDLSPQFSLRSLSSFSEIGMRQFNVDTDGTDIALGRMDRRELTQSYQQEIDLDFDLADGRFTGLVGVFFDREKLKLDSVLSWLPNPQGFVNLSGRAIPVNTATISHFGQRTDSSAIFTDFTYQLTEPFSVYAGYRVSQDKRDLTLTTGLDGLPNKVGLTCVNRGFEDTFNSNTGKVGARYHFANLGNVYAQYQQGYKAGGFNPFGCNDIYDPEKLSSYEVGYKVSLLGGDLTAAIAAFYYDYTNLQVAQIVNNATSIENAASATVKGVEVEATWRITPRLKADTAFSLLDATYNDYRDLDTLNPLAGFQDLSGNPLNRAPDFSGTLGVEADLPVGDAGEATLRAEAFHSTRVQFRPFDAAADSQAA